MARVLALAERAASGGRRAHAPRAAGAFARSASTRMSRRFATPPASRAGWRRVPPAGAIQLATRGRAEEPRRAGCHPAPRAVHALVEAHAAPGLPLWFREGLAGYLERPDARAGTRIPSDAELRQTADPARARRAYARRRRRRRRPGEALRRNHRLRLGVRRLAGGSQKDQQQPGPYKKQVGHCEAHGEAEHLAPKTRPRAGPSPSAERQPEGAQQQHWNGQESRQGLSGNSHANRSNRSLTVAARKILAARHVTEP